MIRAIVVDDEKPSREVICNYLRDYCEDIQVITTASSVKSAFKAIQKHNPDLVFLDIELGDGKGFDLLTMFEKINFKIIFVTAYSDYAIKAFRVNAIDYLLKPVKIDELKEAVEKAKTTRSINSDSERIAALIKSFSDTKSFQKTITIPHLKGFEVLKVNEIIMCKADGYCTEFYLTGKRKVLSTKNLKNYETPLIEYNFIRVHHSFMVNLDHVCSYSKQGEIILTEANRASLGDTYKDDFIKCFGKR
jgi:two-component system, LytTR family, response regulator